MDKRSRTDDRSWRKGSHWTAAVARLVKSDLSLVIPTENRVADIAVKEISSQVVYRVCLPSAMYRHPPPLCQ